MTFGKRRKGIDPVMAARAEGEAAFPTPDEMFDPGDLPRGTRLTRTSEPMPYKPKSTLTDIRWTGTSVTARDGALPVSFPVVEPGVVVMPHPQFTSEDRNAVMFALRDRDLPVRVVDRYPADEDMAQPDILDVAVEDREVDFGAVEKRVLAFVSDDHAARAMWNTAQTVRQTGSAAEIGGVKIYPCDERGRIPADAPVYLQPDPRPSLYISGTISSDPDLTFEEAKARFDAARDYLTALGYRAVSPTDMEGECGRTPEECVGEQKMKMPGQGQGNHSWECYLRGDIRAMLQCAGVATLPNWHRSKGAFLEVQTALGCGMDVRPFDQWPLVQTPLEHAVADVAAMDLNEVAIPGKGTCRLCGLLITVDEDGVWRDHLQDNPNLQRYCTQSKDPDPLHEPTADM